MTDVATTTVSRTEPPESPRPRRGEIAGWVLLVGLTIWILSGTLTHDHTDRPIVGDQASNVMQMLSVAHDGHDLSFDELDLDRWRALHWMNNPHGLYFQRFGDGWAFAKPYGYSLSLVVPYRVFGSPVGVAVANSLLVVAMVGMAVAILRLWIRGAAVPLVAAAFVFGSNAYMHAYSPVVDLFTAVGVAVAVYALLRGLRDEHAGWQVLGFAVVGFLLAEKVPLLTALAPVCGLVLWRSRDWLRRAVLIAATLVVFALAIIPYVYYSDGVAWSAYGGERYYAYGQVPFDPEVTIEPLRITSDETVTVSYLWSVISTPESVVDTAQSAVYYVIGRHTGLLVCFPIALFILAMALARLRVLPGEAVAVLMGLGLYIGFYLILFPDNYYGGGQAIGNRYFLQVSPLVLGLAASARLPGRSLAVAALMSGVLSLTFMPVQHDRPDWAIVDLDRTGWAQQFLPFESNQLGADYWRCGFGVCIDDDEDG